MKKCSKCGKHKNIGSFSKDKYSKSGYVSSCKECKKISWKISASKMDRREYHLNYTKTHKLQRRHNQLKHKFNIGLHEYDTMLKLQNNSCKICGINQEKHVEIFKKVLCVDHSHKNGKIRGLLCEDCNIGLGRFKDNIYFLSNAVEYINEKGD